MASEVTSSPRFFVLEPARGSTHDTEFERTGENMGEAPLCAHCGGIIGLLPWLPPYRGILDLYGQDFGDFVKGPSNGILVSKRFADAFQSEGLTGLPDLHPVEVVRVRRQRRGPKPALVPTYFFTVPVIGGAAVDEAHSHIRRSSPITCDVCRSTGVDAIHGFTLEPGTWRGEDIFRPRGLSRLVVSERFARLVAQYGLTNIQLTATEELVWDPLPLPT